MNEKRESIIGGLVTSTSEQIVRSVRNLSDFILLCLIIDRSLSTVGEAYEQISSGLGKIATSIKKNPILREQAEIAVLAFGVSETTFWATTGSRDGPAFVPAVEFRVPELPDPKGTFIFESYCQSIAQTVHHRDHLVREAREPLATWVFVLSDFHATSPDDQYRETAQEAKAFANEQGVNVFIFPAGEYWNKQVAEELSQEGRPPVHLSAADFDGVFGEWVVRSMHQASMSQYGQSIQLPALKGTQLRAD